MRSGLDMFFLYHTVAAKVNGRLDPFCCLTPFVVLASVHKEQVVKYGVRWKALFYLLSAFFCRETSSNSGCYLSCLALCKLNRLKFWLIFARMVCGK